MFIPRDLAPQIQAAFRESPSVTLTGPRQSGKTTLLRALFPSAAYVHLEEPDVLDFARRDPRGFLRSFPEPMILDEIQYAPALLPYIKAEIDRDRRRRGRFLLTGSQSFALLDSMTESLAGRTIYLNLLPLSAAEAGRGIRSGPVSDVIFRGFYPELHASPELASPESASRWQASYIRTFVERDVRRISNVGDLDLFERFLRLVAARTAQLLNLSELGRDAGVDQSTARRWLSVLRAGFVVFQHLPEHQNLSKRLVKSPKIYFVDVGLCRYLMGLRETTQLPMNQSFGPLFETMVVADVRKQMENQGVPGTTSFFRSSDGIEVDLLLTIGRQRHALEIKATATPTLEHAASLRKWMRLSDTRHATVLCLVEEEKPLGEGIRALPWWDHPRIWS
jgi:predicted AAA+ superfamily ATPase